MSKKITEKLLKWYGHVRRLKEEHIVRRKLDVDVPGKRRRGRPNLRCKDACKRDMTEAGFREDDATNRVEWRKKLISISATPDDGTSLGWRRRSTKRCYANIPVVLRFGLCSP